ncbi:helix-turn-helix domain-containing protein [Micromonospora sp. Llam7]|uniref:helix-turn-helix domain-containing protein n=1 Tax=Micromonospora tarapacensis TaxID=2835305 RepID=UPI001C835212|nr:helix-turn-helix transcriptional regulator [Micromonospora tarapacensis]MBX7266051.1 helix-turn-helix domain-containing protein [Micromonospora tarapacensis]
MSSSSSPTIRARRLRRELRRLRDQRGLTVDEAARAVGWHRAKVIRIEQGHSGIAADGLRKLLDLYGASSEERDALASLARQARQKGWWSVYGDVLPDDYVGFEAEASSISTFQSLYIPGLLQTEQYARALMHAGRATADADEVDRVIAARQARKVLLTRDVPPTLWIVLDEAAVRRAVGGVKVMRAQLARVIEACQLPTVEVQVLPFAAGAHASMGGAFTILDYAEPLLDPTIVYVDNDTNTLLLEEEREVMRYRLVFDHLRAKALDPDQSAEFLVRVSAELQD